MILEDLKYALLNLYCSDGINPFLEHFYMSENKLLATCRNVILEGRENGIDVFFDNSLYLPPNRLEYLNKENTLKTFQSPCSAIEYLHYLIRATKDVRFEMYHYFIYKLQEIGIEYESWSFYYTNNESLEQLIVNSGISNIKKNKKKLNFNIHIMFFKNNTCQMTFLPEEPLWNEGKACPDTYINNIIYYMKKLNVHHYDDIPLNET
ncbi:MAG: hypothetical protein R3E32_09295 [Chitinophagales bacterium]